MLKNQEVSQLVYCMYNLYNLFISIVQYIETCTQTQNNEPRFRILISLTVESF